MRNKNTPITVKATSTEKATEISTTSGIPLAPAAASIKSVGLARDPQHHDDRQSDERQPGEHGRADADDVLDVALDAEPGDDPVHRDRDDQRLEEKRDGGGDVEMRRILHIRLPGDRERQHDRLKREHIEKRVQPRLVEQHEADEHERPGEQMGDVEGEAGHLSVRETNSSSAPRKPSMSAAPTKSGTRNTRILAMLVSNSASARPAMASLTT